MDKSERQEISCNKWRDAKGRGTLNLIMRFGKTRVAAMIVGKLVKAILIEQLWLSLQML